MMERDSRPNVLIVMHQAHSTPGRVGCYLSALGARLDIRRPSLDEPLPETLDDHDGVVVFGGPMCANDDCEWISREIAWLETPLREDKPLLGICLGAQMLAKTLGARVFSYPDRRSEIGYFPLQPDRERGRALRRAVSTPGLSMALRRVRTAGGRAADRVGRPRFPCPGLSLWRQGFGGAVSPRGDLSDDVPVDGARRG